MLLNDRIGVLIGDIGPERHPESASAVFCEVAVRLVFADDIDSFFHCLSADKNDRARSP